MAWYDYIPVAGSVARLAQGDYQQAFKDQITAGSPTGEIINRQVAPWVYKKGQEFGNAVTGAAQEQKQGFSDAFRELGFLAGDQKAFQMQGLDKAEGYYQPATDRINSLYGPPGSFRK